MHGSEPHNLLTQCRYTFQVINQIEIGGAQSRPSLRRSVVGPGPEAARNGTPHPVSQPGPVALRRLSPEQMALPKYSLCNSVWQSVCLEVAQA